MANKWLLDFDSTLNQLDEALLRRVNAVYGTKYSARDISHWDWWGESLTKEQNILIWGEKTFLNRDWTVAREDQQYPDRER